MRPSQAVAAHREKILAIATARGTSNLRISGWVAKGADQEARDLEPLVDIRAEMSLFEYIGLQLDNTFYGCVPGSPARTRVPSRV